VEGPVLRLAGEQEGVVSRRQIRACGGDDDWIDRRVAIGWLVPVFRGVYGIGHPPRTRRGWCVAALLAGGERSVLSHTTAAAVHRMASAERRLHLTLPRTAKGIEGIRTHRPRTLLADDIVVVDGLRVTSPARTLIDLADFRKRRLLKAVIAGHVAGSTITESEAEELFLEIVRRAGLPNPVSQCSMWGRRRDFVWPAQRVRAVKFDQRHVELALRAVLQGGY
jgi:hypothetical protein